MQRVLLVVLMVGCLVSVTVPGGPAAAQATGSSLARVPASAPLAARDLPRGAVLVASDIQFAEGESAADGEPVGWVTRRVLTRGEPLRRPAIAPPDLVRSGDAVQLVWREGAMEIRLSGKAMGSATAGETVLVRVDSKRRFEGIVEAKGIVRLNKPETSGR